MPRSQLAARSRNEYRLPWQRLGHGLRTEGALGSDSACMLMILLTQTAVVCNTERKLLVYRGALWLLFITCLQGGLLPEGNCTRSRWVLLMLLRELQQLHAAGAF